MKENKMTKEQKIAKFEAECDAFGEDISDEKFFYLLEQNGLEPEDLEENKN